MAGIAGGFFGATGKGATKGINSNIGPLLVVPFFRGLKGSFPSWHLLDLTSNWNFFLDPAGGGCLKIWGAFGA